MDSTSEQTISPEQIAINEKVKNKLREYAEFKCLYNLSNAALLFKRNISLICQERVDKNLNINPKRNNYYTAKKPELSVFNLKDLEQDVFGEYISKHNIDIDKEVKKVELEREEKEKMGKKPYGSVMQKKYMAIKKIKDQTENNEKNGDKKRTRKNYNFYVIQEKNKNEEQNKKVKADVVISNCKRRSMLDKQNKEENKKKEETKTNNNVMIMINSRGKNKEKLMNKEEKKEEKKE